MGDLSNSNLSPFFRNVFLDDVLPTTYGIHFNIFKEANKQEENEDGRVIVDSTCHISTWLSSSHSIEIEADAFEFSGFITHGINDKTIFKARKKVETFSKSLGLHVIFHSPESIIHTCDDEEKTTLTIDKLVSIYDNAFMDIMDVDLKLRSLEFKGKQFGFYKGSILSQQDHKKPEIMIVSDSVSMSMDSITSSLFRIISKNVLDIFFDQYVYMDDGYCFCDETIQFEQNNTADHLSKIGKFVADAKDVLISGNFSLTESLYTKGRFLLLNGSIVGGSLTAEEEEGIVSRAKLKLEEMTLSSKTVFQTGESDVQKASIVFSKFASVQNLKAKEAEIRQTGEERATFFAQNFDTQNLFLEVLKGSVFLEDVILKKAKMMAGELSSIGTLSVDDLNLETVEGVFVKAVMVYNKAFIQSNADIHVEKATGESLSVDANGDVFVSGDGLKTFVGKGQNVLTKGIIDDIQSDAKKIASHKGDTSSLRLKAFVAKVQGKTKTLVVDATKTTLKDVAAECVTMDTKDLLSIGLLDVGTLTIKGVGDVSIQKLKIQKKAEINAKNILIDKAEGQELVAHSENVTLVSAEELKILEAEGKTVLTTGDIDDLTIKAKDYARSHGNVGKLNVTSYFVSINGKVTVLDVDATKTTLKDVITETAKITGQDITSIGFLDVGTLTIEGTGDISLQQVIINDNATISGHNVFIQKAEGKKANVTAKNLIQVNGDGLEECISDGKIVLTSGDIKTIKTKAKELACHNGTSEDVTLEALSVCVDGKIRHLTVDSKTATINGDIKEFDAKSLLTYLDSVTIGKLSPGDKVFITNHGHSRIGQIVQESGKTLNLMNHGTLTVIDKVTLALQSFINDGLVQFLSPSSVSVEGGISNRGQIEGRGSLQINAQNEFGLGDIDVKAFHHFINRTPIKGKSFDYAPFDDEGLKPTIHLSLAELSDFDNQSGFFALDMDAKYAQKILLDNLNTGTVRHLIAGELLRSLLDENNTLPESFITATKEMLDLYKSLSNTDPKKEEALNTLKGWCLDDGVLISYIRSVIGADEFGLFVDADNNPIYGTMDALSALQGYALEVYVPYFGSIKKVHTFNPKDHEFVGDFKVCRVLFNKETGHFDRLLEDHEWNEVPVFLTEEEGMKGALKLALNRAFFTDEILSNPHFKADHMMHYVLGGDQSIKKDHTFNLKTIIETDSHLDLSAKLKAKEDLFLKTGILTGKDFGILGDKSVDVDSKFGIQLEDGTVSGKGGTAVKTAGSFVEKHVDIGTTESATRIDVGGDYDSSCKKRVVGDNEEVDRSKLLGKTVDVNVGGNYTKRGTTTESVESTNINVGGDYKELSSIPVVVDGKQIEVPLCAKHVKTRNIHRGTRTDVFEDPIVNENRSNGSLSVHAKGSSELKGSQWKARTIDVKGDNGVKVLGVKKGHSYQQRQGYSHKWGFIDIKDEETRQGRIEKAQKAVLESLEKTTIESKEGNVTFAGVDFKSPLTEVFAKQGKVLFDQLKCESETKVLEQTAGLFWQSVRETTTKRTRYTDNSTTGKIEVDAKEVESTVLEGRERHEKEKGWNGYTLDENRIRDHTKDFYTQIVVKNGGKITQQYVKDVLSIESVEKGGPGVVLSACIAIAIAYATAGVGSSLAGYLGTNGIACSFISSGVATTINATIGGMAVGAITTLATTCTLALLSCNGDIDEAWKMIWSRDTAKNLIISMVTAGVTAGVCSGFKIPTCAFERGFLENVGVNAARTTAYLGTKLLLDRKLEEDLVIKESVNVVVQATCAYLCQKVGELRSGISNETGNPIIDQKTGLPIEKMDYISHKLSHAAIGALGGITDGEKGMISGAAGGALGEVFAEALVDAHALRSEILEEYPNYDVLSKDDQKSILLKKTDTQRFTWKFMSSITAGLAGCDVNMAYHAADTAIENNAIQVIFGALMIGYVAYVGYQVGSEVANGNYEEALKILGIEVVTAAVGGVVVKGAAKAFKLIGSTKTYSTVAEAMGAAYEKTPGLKKFVGTTHNKIVKAFEKFESSAVGQKNISTGAENASNRVQFEELSQYIDGSSSINALKLKIDLIAEQISKGHAFEKHVLRQGEFPRWIRTRDQLKDHIVNILSDSQSVKYSFRDGRSAYIQ